MLLMSQRVIFIPRALRNTSDMKLRSAAFSAVIIETACDTAQLCHHRTPRVVVEPHSTPQHHLHTTDEEEAHAAERRRPSPWFWGCSQLSDDSSFRRLLGPGARPGDPGGGLGTASLMKGRPVLEVESWQFCGVGRTVAVPPPTHPPPPPPPGHALRSSQIAGSSGLRDQAVHRKRMWSAGLGGGSVLVNRPRWVKNAEQRLYLKHVGAKVHEELGELFVGLTVWLTRRDH